MSFFSEGKLLFSIVASCLLLFRRESCYSQFLYRVYCYFRGRAVIRYCCISSIFVSEGKLLFSIVVSCLLLFQRATCYSLLLHLVYCYFRGQDVPSIVASRLLFFSEGKLLFYIVASCLLLFSEGKLLFAIVVSCLLLFQRACYFSLLLYLVYCYFRGQAVIPYCCILSIVISEGKLGKEEDPPVAEAEGAEQLGITIAIVCVCLPVVLFIIIDATYICQIYDKFKAKSGDKQC